MAISLREFRVSSSEEHARSLAAVLGGVGGWEDNVITTGGHVPRR